MAYPEMSIRGRSPLLPFDFFLEQSKKPENKAKLEGKKWKKERNNYVTSSYVWFLSLYTFITIEIKLNCFTKC